MYHKRLLAFFIASSSFLAILVKGDNNVGSGVNADAVPPKASYPPGDVRRCLAEMGKTVQRFEVLPGGGWDNLQNKVMGMVSYMNYSLCKTTEDGKFLIPDGVMTVPVKRSRVQTFAELFEHWTNYTCSTSRGVNIHAGLHLSHFGISGSFSDEYSSVKEKQFYDKSVTTRIQVRYVRYEAKLQPDTPYMAEFQERLGKIAAHVTLNRTTLSRYESQLLVRDFGTHLITSVDVGAALIQLDEIRAEFARKYDSETSSIRAAASASFFGVFDIGGGYSQTVTKAFLDEYKKSRTSSHIDTLGGPIYKPQNYTADLWTDSIDSNMVALDRSGDPIYFSINEQTLPEVPASTVYQVYKQVKDAVDEYYKHNTYRGCTKPNAPNFDFQANVDDGTCTAAETNYTFGGVFQKCSPSGYTNLCTDLDQKNPLTGDHTCSEGYDAILLQTGTKSSSTTRHECHSCYLFFHCCDDNTYTASATFSAYWCAARGTVPQNHGFLFGGLYSPMLNNPLTMAKECPTQFYKLKILDNLVVCVSDDYELGYQYSLPFAGFYSCKSGNPLVMKKQETGLKSKPLTILQSFMMESGPAAYPKECPKGYSQHLAAIYDSCEVNYCVRYGALSPQGLPKLQRPPFIEAPLSNYMQIGPATSSIVFNDDGSVWMTGKEAALEFGHSSSPKGLGSSTPTGNSKPTPSSSSSSSSSSSNGISSGGVAAISIFVTLFVVAVLFIVVRTIRKRRSSLYRYDDCDRE